MPVRNPRGKLMLLASAALFLLAFPGCGPDSSTTSPESAASPSGRAPEKKMRGTIGLSVLSLGNPFFKVISDSMAEEAARHGYAVQTVDGNFDVARQQNQVKDFIVQKVSAIVLTPCDSKAIGPAIQEANAAGIPVFTADIACLAEEADVVCHVATDNYQGGKEAAKAMMEALNDQGTVAILDHPVIESVMLRTQGFRDQLQESDSKLEIVRVLPGGGERDKSFKAAEDLIQTYPNIDGIFAINDPSALGAIGALEKANKLEQVAIVGFDGQPEGKQAIREGKIYADPIQFPERIGQKVAEVVAHHFEGVEVPREVLIPTKLYRREDAMNDPELK